MTVELPEVLLAQTELQSADHLAMESVKRLLIPYDFLHRVTSASEAFRHFCPLELES